MVQPLHKQLQQTVARVSSSRVRPLQHFLMLRQQQLSDFMPKTAGLSVKTLIWGWRKSIPAGLATWNSHTVCYTSWIVGNVSPMALKLTARRLRLLDNVVRKIDFLVVLATWNFVCESELCQCNRETKWWDAGVNILQSELTKLWCTLNVTFSGLNSQKCQFLQVGQ